MTLFGYSIDLHHPIRLTPQRPPQAGGECTTLADIQPGRLARIIAFSDRVSPARVAHLQAYGLTPESVVRVLQLFPVAIVLIEYCELALETDLARLVEVEAV